MITLPVQEPAARRSFFRLTAGKLWPLAIILLAVWLPRALKLDQFVTPDEHLWVFRSANFYYALTHLDFGATYQKEHPGVTVMWAGTAGYLAAFPGYRGSGMGQVDSSDQLHYYLRRVAEVPPLEILTASRVVLVLAHTAALGLSFLFAWQLAGLWGALAGFLIIAFDPLHLALSRVLHLDGLLSNLTFLSLLAFLSYTKSHRRLDLLVSGVAAGFSWLTKSPGFFLIPVVGILALWDLVQNLRKADGRTKTQKVWAAAWPLIQWGVLGGLIFFAFWPSMWVNPLGTLDHMLSKAEDYAESGHESAVFFNGMIAQDGSLGLPYFYFYPLTYLWRTTPVALLGLLAAGIAFLRRWKPFDQQGARWLTLGLLLWAGLYMLIMTLGAKKFDRYLLPAYPPLDLLAGLGYAALALVVSPSRWASARATQALPVLLVTALAAAQAAFALPTFPYYFSYYNPLLGGSRAAPQVMQIGWGEGLDEAARYLNSKPEAEHLHVTSWYSLGSFSYISSSHTRYFGPKVDWTENDWERFNTSDYAVVYIHQWQRNLPSEALAQLTSREPEHSVWIDGLEYARIYRLR